MMQTKQYCVHGRRHIVNLPVQLLSDIVIYLPVQLLSDIVIYLPVQLLSHIVIYDANKTELIN